MATLRPFTGPHDGPLRIYSYILMSYVGAGSFTSFEDFKAEFRGTYNAFGQNGQVAIGIALTDRNASAPSGPCTLSVNDQTDSAATYRINGDKLTITTRLNPTGIDYYIYENGTQIDNLLAAHSVWIGP